MMFNWWKIGLKDAAPLVAQAVKLFLGAYACISRPSHPHEGNETKPNKELPWPEADRTLWIPVDLGL